METHGRQHMEENTWAQKPEEARGQALLQSNLERALLSPSRGDSI